MATPPKVRESPVCLWPKPVPLECGVIRNQPGASEKGTGTNKFTLFNLKKIYSYLKTKGKGAYPHLRYSVWLHIVKNKFGFSDDLAWLYFELFDVVSELDSAERLKLQQTADQCATQEELESFRKKLSVDTTRFLLFLYIQSTPRLTLKGLATTGDEWPSPESESKQRFPEAARLTFVKNHISEILQLLVDTDESTEEQYLTPEAVSALDFLICSSQQSNQMSKLGSLACKYQQESGYSSVQNRFSPSQFEQWLKAHFTFNPYGPQAVYSRRRETRVSCFSSEGLGRLLANNLTASEGNRTAVLGRLVNQTLSVGESSLAGCDVHIRNCRRSSIYLLSPLRSVQIEKCSHCVLVLGAVQSVTVVSNCDSITLVAACRKIHVSSSSLCTLHLLTMTRPLVFPSCFHLCLAPYNTYYPQLEAHQLVSGLNPLVKNQWNNPLMLGNDEDASVVWELMPPENFRPVSIPFTMEGSTQENPCPLPQPFQRVLAARRESIKRWYDTVSKAQLTEEQSTQLQKTVSEKFQEWLSSNGYDKDIAALSVGDTSCPPKSSQSTKT